nr:uncharacterized protein LOC105846359 [Hydra vulgaris]
MNVFDPKCLILGLPIFESEISFKKGLHSQWVESFLSLYHNMLVVYATKEKLLPLQHFMPKTSTLSVGLKTEKRVFEIISQTDTTLYLFETSSDFFADIWILNLKNAGWKLIELYPWNDSTYFNQDNDFKINEISNQLTKLTNLNEKKEEKFMESHSISYLTDDKKFEVEMVTEETEEQISESGYVSKVKLEGKTRKKSVFIHAQEMNKDYWQNYEEKLDLSEDIKYFNNEDLKAKNMKKKHKDIYSIDIDHDIINNNNLYVNKDIFPKNITTTQKRHSMYQLFTNIKSRFGSTTSHKSASRRSRSLQDYFTSKLLWNYNGQWTSINFVFENGSLLGYKDADMKLLEVELNVRECIITTISSVGILPKLNLFKLGLTIETGHIFAAWNEEDYNIWLQVLGNFAKERVDINLSEINSREDVSYAPYGQRNLRSSNLLSTSSEVSSVLTEGHPDFIDSGNDGDESGLEVPHERISILINKNEKLSQQAETDSIFQNSDHCNEYLKKAKVRNDSLTSFTNESGNHDSPLFDLKPTVTNVFRVPQENKKKNPFNKNRWSMLDLAKVNDRTSSFGSKQANSSKIQIGTSNMNGHSVLKKNNEPIMSIIRNSDRNSSNNFSKNHANHFYRSNSLTVSPFVNKNISSTLTNEEKNHLNNLHSDSQETMNMIILDTLLRKRRNSLTLEKGHIAITLESLNETLKKNKECESKRERINSLEKKLHSINLEINNINQKIKGIPPKLFNHEQPMQHIRSSIIKNKFKLNTNKRKISFESGSSLSIESFASSDSMKECQTGDDVCEIITETTLEGSSVSELTGIQQLLLTTEKIENKHCVVNENFSILNKRSQSLDNMKKSIKGDDSKTSKNAKLIIEDFEIFSQQLFSNMEKMNKAK